jgi:hypothetical protein
MSILRSRLILLLPITASLSACGESTAPVTDAGVDSGVTNDVSVEDGVGGFDAAPDTVEEVLDTAVDSNQGEPCEVPADCTSLQCLEVAGVGSAICTELCASDRDCVLEGWSCVFVVNSGSDATRVCVPQDVCIDADDDGFGVGTGCTGPDCNDDDPQVFLGADELCNGRDDDCDGTVDEQFVGVGEACETGFQGVCGAGRQSCVDGSLICQSFATGSAEQCNGVDDDCDGDVDEADDGSPLQQPCYSADVATEGVGLCRGGARVCTDGVLQACSGEVLPLPVELCNGLDDDCDGSVDEGAPSGGVRCQTTLPGVCRQGLTLCAGGEVTCVADIAVGTQTEICNGLDDDCDGLVDEGPTGVPLTRSCYSGDASTLGEGACVGGVQSCVSGTFGACVGEVLPSPVELCNGLDDDCDGTVDEDSPFEGFRCETGLAGACSLGFTICEDGGSVCIPDRFEDTVAETCNGVDDDCNGEIDDLGQPLCPLQQGVCAGARATCRPGGGSLVCSFIDYGDDYEFIELSCDGLDNDCNGVVDDIDLDRDGFVDADCGGEDCNDQIAFINPDALEICGNTVDEDCSGRVGDRDLDGDGANDDDDRCETPGNDCDDNNAAIRPGATEIRDGFDNDCDAQWDEGLIRAGDLIVSEIMRDPDTTADATGEWFEVYNTTDTAIALNSFSFLDLGGDRFDVSPQIEYRIPARSYAALCDISDPARNGGVSNCLLAYDGISLANGDDEVVIQHLGVEIDRVAYAGGWPNNPGRSMAFRQTLIGGSTADSVENNTSSNWCSTPANGANQLKTNGDYGTPGRANTCP